MANIVNSRYRDMLEEICKDPNTRMTGVTVKVNPGVYVINIVFDNDPNATMEMFATTVSIETQYEHYKRYGHITWEKYAPSYARDLAEAKKHLADVKASVLLGVGHINEED